MLDDKIGILDIRAKINNNINCNVEMQIIDNKDIEKRILYYWSKMYSKTIKEGKKYNELEKCIVILFADYKLENLKHIEKYITKWNIREEENKQTILTDMLEIYIIEMSKYKEEGKENELDTWLNFLIKPEVISMSEKNKAVAKAKKVLEEISQDEREIYLAELREKYILDQISIEETGIEKGIKGATIAIAKKMKEDKVEIETICKYTGLTKEEIEKI